MSGFSGDGRRCPVWHFQKETAEITNEINGILILELNAGQNHRDSNRVKRGTSPKPFSKPQPPPGANSLQVSGGSPATAKRTQRSGNAPFGKIVGPDGDAGPLILKNLPSVCRRRRRKISWSDVDLDCGGKIPFNKKRRPCCQGRRV